MSMDAALVGKRAPTSGKRIVSLEPVFTLWKIYWLIAIGVNSLFARWDTKRFSVMLAIKVSLYTQTPKHAKSILLHE